MGGVGLEGIRRCVAIWDESTRSRGYPVHIKTSEVLRELESLLTGSFWPPLAFSLKMS
jgi:hypothetical protein